MSTQKNRSFQMRVSLDSIFSRRTSSSSTSHWVGSTFKSFSVIAVSDESVVVRLAPDPANASIGSIPLRLGYYQNFQTEVGNACFENSAIQPNQWIDVLFFSEDEMDSNPAQVKTQSSTVKVGNAVGEIDGYSREIQAKWKYSNGGLQYVKDTQNNDYNVGTCTGKTELFKCPSGFTGRIIGLELNVTQVPDSIPLVMSFYAIDDGRTLTSEVAGDSNQICHIMDYQAVPSTGYYDGTPMVHLPDASGVVNKGTLRKGCIINENEVLVLLVPNNSGSAGEVFIKVLLRLEPIQRAG